MYSHCSSSGSPGLLIIVPPSCAPWHECIQACSSRVPRNHQSLASSTGKVPSLLLSSCRCPYQHSLPTPTASSSLTLKDAHGLSRKTLISALQTSRNTFSCTISCCPSMGSTLLSYWSLCLSTLLHSDTLIRRLWATSLCTFSAVGLMGRWGFIMLS